MTVQVERQQEQPALQNQNQQAGIVQRTEKDIPREFLELLSELEFHWAKAKVIIPRLFEIGTAKGMSTRQIRRLIKERIDMTTRQVRNLTPSKYKDIAKRRTGKARRGRSKGKKQLPIDYSRILVDMEDIVNNKHYDAKTKVKRIVKMLKREKLV